MPGRSYLRRVRDKNIRVHLRAADAEKPFHDSTRFAKDPSNDHRNNKSEPPRIRHAPQSRLKKRRVPCG